MNSLLTNLLAIPFVTLILLPLCLLQMLIVTLADWPPAFLGDLVYYLVDALLCMLQWFDQQLPWYHEIRLSGTALGLCVLSALLALLPGIPLLRAGSFAIFLVLLHNPSYQHSRMMLLNHAVPLAVLQENNNALVIDGSFGLSERERRLVSEVLPGDPAQRTSGLSQAQWLAADWRVYLVSSGSGEVIALDPCTAKPSELSRLAESVGLTRWQRYPLRTMNGSEEPDACAFAFVWQHARWLWLGQLTREQQMSLLQSSAFRRGQYQVVVAGSQQWMGALYNHLSDARWYVSGGPATGARPVASMVARGIEVIFLQQSGALLFEAHSPHVARQLVSRRFYHRQQLDSAL